MENHTPIENTSHGLVIRLLRGTVHRKLLFLFLIGLVAIGAAACVDELTPRGGWSSVTESGDWVYVGTRDGQLVRFNKVTGIRDGGWRYPPVGTVGAIYSTPLVKDGIIYSVAYTRNGNSYTGQVFALVEETGRTAWSSGPYPSRSSQSSLEARLVGGTALTNNDSLLFGVEFAVDTNGAFGYLYALDATVDVNSSFEEQVINRFQWRLPVDSGIWGGVSLYEDTAYFGTKSGTIYAVDVRDKPEYARDPMSRILWRFNGGGVIVATPLINDGKMYIGSFGTGGTFFALDLAARAEDETEETLQTGREWSFKTSGGIWADALLDNDILYVSTLAGRLYALDSRTGSERWSEPADIGSPIVAAPALLRTNRDSFLAVPSFEEDIHIVGLGGFYDKRVYKTNSGTASSPLLTDKFLYSHSIDGNLYRFDPISLNLQACYTDLGEEEVKSCG